MSRSITVQYASSRALIFKWYWNSLRTSSRHRFLWGFNMAIVALAAFAVARGRYGLRAAAAISVGVLGAAASAAFSILYPQLRFKPQERTLTVSEDGIDTTIGRRSGHVPWAQVASVEKWRGITLVRSRKLNAFLVPATAFDSPDAEQAFVEFCRECMKGVHA